MECRVSRTPSLMHGQNFWDLLPPTQGILADILNKSVLLKKGRSFPAQRVPHIICKVKTKSI